MPREYGVAKKKYAHLCPWCWWPEYSEYVEDDVGRVVKRECLACGTTWKARISPVEMAARGH